MVATVAFATRSFSRNFLRTAPLPSEPPGIEAACNGDVGLVADREGRRDIFEALRCTGGTLHTYLVCRKVARQTADSAWLGFCFLLPTYLHYSTVLTRK